ncbi:MAG TPA: patatin-like phospholipase family protein [Candidatus Angelobacter sp.]|nr:patatin-like phospholipase family protein [Candidatus Angelobacter sp.]
MNSADRHAFSLGLALSGGGFRGLAHIGVLRVLERDGMQPDFIAGTSAGSLIGALYASGKTTHEIESIAMKVFWPGLLRTQGIRSFSRKYLPRTFEELAVPFRVAVTELPSWKTCVLDSGDLASALAASCATPYLLHRVRIDGASYTDGGWAAVLPSVICRASSCRIVIGSDVWLRSSLGRKSGVKPDGKFSRQVYSRQYVEAYRQCDVVVHPRIAFYDVVPSVASIRRMIQSGEQAASVSLAKCRALAV